MNYGTKRIPHILTYLVLSLWALTTIYPFIWVALNSFRKSAKRPDDITALYTLFGKKEEPKRPWKKKVDK